MANVTATSSAPFIPEIWANEALEILRANIVLAPLVTKDTDLATFNVGNILSIPYPGTLAANAKVANTPVTKQVPSSTSTTVTLNRHFESTILIEDFARAQALPFLMQSYIKAEVIALAEQVETDLISLYSTFSGSLGTSGTDLSAATLRAVNKKFTDNKVPKGNRHLLIATKDTAALQADSTLQYYFAQATPDDIQHGTVATPIYGTQLHESQLVPVVTGTPNSTKDLAFDSGAIILASRALPEAPAGTGVAQSIVQDPVSGLVFRCSMSYNADNLGVQVTMDTLYGFAVLRDAKGFTVLT